MSYLLPVEVEGDGVDVESLSSYLAKIVSKHGVGYAVFSSMLAKWANQTLELDWVPGSAGHGATMHVNGYRENDGNLVRILSAASEQPAILGTNLFILERFDPGRSVQGICNRRRWCSACWRDDRKSGRAPYDRLMWSISSSDRCTKHKTALEFRCPTCDRDFRRFGIGGDITQCWWCGGSLLIKRIHATKVPPSPSEKHWCGVIERASKDPTFQFRADAAKVFLDATLEHLKRDITSAGRSLLRQLNRMFAFLNNRAPSMDALVLLANATNTNLAALLEYPEEAAKAVRPNLADIAKAAWVRSPRVDESIRVAIEVDLVSQLGESTRDRAPTLLETATRHGVTHASVTKWFPELAQRVIERQRQISLIKKQRAEEILNAELLPGLATGKWRSRIVGCTELAAKHGLPPSFLDRAAIKRGITLATVSDALARRSQAAVGAGRLRGSRKSQKSRPIKTVVGTERTTTVRRIYNLSRRSRSR